MYNKCIESALHITTAAIRAASSCTRPGLHSVQERFPFLFSTAKCPLAEWLPFKKQSCDHILCSNQYRKKPFHKRFTMFASLSNCLHQSLLIGKTRKLLWTSPSLFAIANTSISPLVTVKKLYFKQLFSGANGEKVCPIFCSEHSSGDRSRISPFPIVSYNTVTIP